MERCCEKIKVALPLYSDNDFKIPTTFAILYSTMGISLSNERPGQPKTPESGAASTQKPPEKRALTRDQIRDALLSRAASRAFTKNPDASGQVTFLDPVKQKLNTDLQALKAMQGESNIQSQSSGDSEKLAQRIKVLQEQLRDEPKPVRPQEKVVLAPKLAEAATTQRAVEAINTHLDGTDTDSLASAYGVPGSKREVDISG